MRLVASRAVFGRGRVEFVIGFEIRLSFDSGGHGALSKFVLELHPRAGARSSGEAYSEEPGLCDEELSALMKE